MSRKNVKPTNYEFSEPFESVDQIKGWLTNSRYSGTLYHRTNRNADGTPQRWRVSGQLQTWKRNADRIRLPIKHGMYVNDAIESLEDFNLLAISYKATISEE